MWKTDLLCARPCSHTPGHGSIYSQPQTSPNHGRMEALEPCCARRTWLGKEGRRKCHECLSLKCYSDRKAETCPQTRLLQVHSGHGLVWMCGLSHLLLRGGACLGSLLCPELSPGSWGSVDVFCALVQVLVAPQVSSQKPLRLPPLTFWLGTLAPHL